MRTGMLVTPSLEEVQLAGAKIGLPDIECQKFFHYYSSNGWKVGKNRMVSFPNALAHWKIVWQERNGARTGASVPGSSKPDTAERVQTFYQRINGQ